jgi:hypothetical protein
MAFLIGGSVKREILFCFVVVLVQREPRFIYLHGSVLIYGLF